MTPVIEMLTKFRVITCDMSRVHDMFLPNDLEHLKVKVDIYEALCSLFTSPNTTLFLPIEFQTNVIGMAHLNAFVRSNRRLMPDVYGNYIDNLELVQVVYLNNVQA